MKEREWGWSSMQWSSVSEWARCAMPMYSMLFFSRASLSPHRRQRSCLSSLFILRG